jgi:outer membrane protein assembly factor BamB
MMIRKILFLAILGMFALQAYCTEESLEFNKYWHQWRGPNANGVASNGNPPIEWAEDKNVKWKMEIPGKGHASPIVWGDMVFVLTAIETDKIVKDAGSSDKDLPEWRKNEGSSTNKVHKFVILAINRKDGKVIWEKTAYEAVPNEGTHQEGSWASNSPITDGEHVYAYFGSYGLYCYDMQGNLIWSKDFGDMKVKMSFGEGNSPALFGNTIVINWDHTGECFIVALDKKTGDEIWRKKRDEITSWSTPLIVDYNGIQQVIVNATKRIRSYDLKNGDLIWECAGMTENVIPAPVYANGMVYLMSGFRGNALLAIDLNKASGDITGTDAIIWKRDKDTPYTPSPLLYEDKLYFLFNNDGVISCFDAKTGQSYYSRERLKDINGTFVSLVAANSYVYAMGKNGVTYVIKAGSKFEVASINTLADNFTASPAIVGNEIYLRGYKYLYCIDK